MGEKRLLDFRRQEGLLTSAVKKILVGGEMSAGGTNVDMAHRDGYWFYSGRGK